MLPDLDGLEVTRRLRSDGLRTPVLFLTARDATEDKVSGLTVGGDDYVTKPFSLAEVVARVRAVLRRTSPGGVPAEGVLRFEDLVMDEETREVWRDGTPVHLTATEFNLLRFFLQNPRRVLSKAQILDHVWQYDFDGDANVVETYVSYLRKKLDRLGPPLIQTVRLVGYSLRRATVGLSAVPRTMSLRARLLVVLLAVAAAVAVTVDGVTYFSLRSFLVQRVDAQLDAAHRPIIRSMRSVRSSLQAADLEALAPGLYVEIRDPTGRVTEEVALRRAGEEAISPRLPAVLAVPEEMASGKGQDDAAVRTVSTDGGGRFRVATWRLSSSGAALVLALPLDDLDSTLRRLLLVELVVTGAALAGGVVLARWLVTLGLRPLDDIATTAGAIAGGDLSRRVDREEPTTEVGRLGGALNAMLGQIEHAFAERRASEDRLRRFVADASHELRTPLTSIRAYAELFDRGADRRPDDLARVLKGIESEAERMGDARRRPAPARPARPGTGPRRRARRPRRTGRGSPSTPRGPSTLPVRSRSTVDGSVEVEGDRVRLRQVVDNLLANVRAHTPAGVPATVSVSADRERGVAVLAVTDQGPGIPVEDQGRVFERFFRADPSRSRDAGGAGLGLAIVAAIAAAHGGRAGVASGPGGVGSTFRIELPLLLGADS